ncbi:MAG TPA: class II aldolase/adducin family protein [Magnetospirillaceae bacterium]|nr:class II aldolase/adducin family protein [Magnetospirillaceae bacterium]
MEMDEIYGSFRETREELAYYMRRLYLRGLTTCAGGNLSVRPDHRHVIITPSGPDKGRTKSGKMVLLTMDGTNLTPYLSPSIEASMHLSVYRARPDVRAVVHAHPPYAASFSAMRADIDTKLTAETYYVLGTPARAGYAPMGSENLAELAAEAVKAADVVVLENHGILAVGSTLILAYERLEVLEAAAKMTIITSLMGCPSPLPGDRIVDLDIWRAAKAGGPPWSNQGEG